MEVMWHDDETDDKSSPHTSTAPADDAPSLFARGTEHLLSKRQTAHTSFKQGKQQPAARCGDEACDMPHIRVGMPHIRIHVTCRI
jgi:hypothetical protein